MTRKTGNFARRVTNNQDGRSVHDSPPGFGTTHSILQRRINRICLVEQSRHLSRQKTSVVSRPPTPTRPGQCPNQTVESRINQVNQTHPSISGRRRCGGTGWPAGRGNRIGRGFGDGTRGTMVEAHDIKQPVDPQTPHYTGDQERQRSSHHQSYSHCQERESFYQSKRRYQSSFRSHSRTAQDPGKIVSRKCFGERQRQRQRSRSRSGTIETLTWVGRLGPRQKVTTTFGLRQ